MGAPWYYIIIFIVGACLVSWIFDKFQIIKSKSLCNLLLFRYIRLCTGVSMISLLHEEWRVGGAGGFPFLGVSIHVAYLFIELLKPIIF